MDGKRELLELIIGLMKLYKNNKIKIIRIQPEYSRGVEEDWSGLVSGVRKFKPSKLITLTIAIGYQLDEMSVGEYKTEKETK